MTALIVGIGSPHGDDQAGWLLADRFRANGAEGLIARRAMSPVDLLHWLDDVDRLVVCDACAPAGCPGRQHRWIWPSDGIRRGKLLSSHALPLSDVLEMAAALGRLPEHVSVFAIEAEACRPDSGVSAAVQTALPGLEAAIREALTET